MLDLYFYIIFLSIWSPVNMAQAKETESLRSRITHYYSVYSRDVGAGGRPSQISGTAGYPLAPW